MERPASFQAGLFPEFCSVIMAAEHHENAAKSHRAAATQYEKSDKAAAPKHSEHAHGQSTNVHERPSTAHAKSKH